MSATDPAAHAFRAGGSLDGLARLVRALFLENFVVP